MTIQPLIHLIILKLENYHYGMLFFVAFFLTMFAWLWYKARASRYWARGIFPPFYDSSEKNVIEAYTALGAIMLSIDPNTPRDKVDYILYHFARNFKFVDNNFRENIIYAMRNRVTPKSVTDWVNKTLKSEKQKKKIIEFLANVGMVDGDLTNNERTFIKMINGYLRLSPTTVNTIIENIDRTQRSNREYAKKKAAPRPTINKAYGILGISQRASDNEIKKAYRNLVKIHHPDNFANDSEAKQQKAEDRFIEIQKAYESLTN